MSLTKMAGSGVGFETGSVSQSYGSGSIPICHRSATLGKICVTSIEAQFIVPDRGNKVDYGIGLSYQPVRLGIDSWAP
jgi:hypothetical protein